MIDIASRAVSVELKKNCPVNWISACARNPTPAWPSRTECSHHTVDASSKQTQLWVLTRSCIQETRLFHAKQLCPLSEYILFLYRFLNPPIVELKLKTTPTCSYYISLYTIVSYPDLIPIFIRSHFPPLLPCVGGKKFKQPRIQEMPRSQLLIIKNTEKHVI